ncbi:MAG TPA: MurR/RpiR family transcriptional regulator [Candidatus Acidoferrales bacterium]|nr:MurR/RpiR family transcriptional regulator [Candidatus Acidoferrales bacterium]
MTKKRKTKEESGFPGLVRALSPKRQEVIRPLLEHPRRYVLHSLRDLAKELNSAPATLLRIAREMGFKRFHDFRRYLHELSVAQATPFRVMESTTENSGLDGRVDESMNRDMANIRGLSHSLDKKQLLALVKRLYSADRVLILGGDMAESLARFLEYNLTVIGISAVAVSSAGEVAHRLRQLTRKDVVIGISFRRGLRLTVDGLRQARSRGAYTVGVTDSSLSPVARYADEYFVTPTEGPLFAGSYVAAMALLNALLVACSNYRRSHTLDILREAEKEQRTGFRWFSDN